MKAETLPIAPHVPLAQQSAERKRPWLPVLLLLAAVPALVVDVPLAGWLLADYCPDPLEKILHLCEVFSHGLGVLGILVAAWVLAPTVRRRLPLVVVASLGAGLAANGVKLLVARTRPRSFDLAGDVVETFGGWLPLLEGGSAQQSFPSAHSATAAGFAVALVWLFPRGRWLFPALAVLAMCQRMEAGAHYLSDTLAGAALGVVVGRAAIGSRPLARLVDRWGRWKPADEQDAAAPKRRRSA